MRILLFAMPDSVSGLDPIIRFPNLGLRSVAGNLDGGAGTAGGSTGPAGAPGPGGARGAPPGPGPQAPPSPSWT